MYYRIDPETGAEIECGGRAVQCRTPDCPSYATEIEVPDDPYSIVMCGACNAVLAQPERTDKN